MNQDIFLYTGLVFSGLILALFLANEPKEKRYRQRFLPLVSLILSILACIVALRYIDVAEQVFRVIRNFVFQISGYDPSFLTNYDLLFPLINFALLLILLIIKGGGRITGLVHDLFRYLLALIKRKDASRRPFPAALAPAYEYCLDRGISLRDNWVYPGRYCMGMGWLSILLFLIFLAVFSYDGTLLQTYDLFRLPAIPLIIFLETGWYLSGPRPLPGQGKFTGTDANARDTGSFAGLWHRYAEICPERIIATNPQVSYLVNPGATGGSVYDGMQNHVTGTRHEAMIIERTMIKNRGTGLDERQKDALRNGLENNDLLFIEPTCRQAVPVLFALLQRDLLRGGHILFLLPADSDRHDRDQIEQWIKRECAGIYYVPMNPTVAERPKEGAQIICATIPDVLTSPWISSWLQALSRVVVLDIALTFFSNRAQARECCDLLSDTCPRTPAYLLLAGSDRITSESSLRDFLEVAPREYLFQRSGNRRHAYHVWKSEGRPLIQEHVLRVDNKRYFGNEIPLAIPALRDGIGSVDCLGIACGYWREEREEMAKILPDLLSANALESHRLPIHHTPGRRGVVIARDNTSNLVAAIQTGLDFNTRETLLLCVSPPYLLRDYLAKNIQYFLDTDALTSFLITPRPLGTRATTAVYLFNRMKNNQVKEEDICRHLNMVDLDCDANGVRGALVILFQETFGVHLIHDALLLEQTSYDYNSRGKCFMRTRRFSLAGNAERFVDFTPYVFYRVVDESDKTLALLHSDTLYQNYLPFQVHGFAGEPYRIVEINTRDHLVRVQHTPPVYGKIHPVITAVVEGTPRCKSLDGGRPRVFNGISLRREILEADMTVKTHGYHTFENGWDIHSYTPLNPGPWSERRYDYARILILQISVLSGIIPDDIPLPEIEKTLALLLHELMPTVFPDTCSSLLVSSPNLADSKERYQDWPKTRNPFDLLPRIQIGGGDLEDESAITIVFAEDAFFDQGMIGGLVEHWNLLFALLEDYITWLLEGEGSDLQSDYLLYGNDELHAFVRLTVVRDILKAIITGYGTLPLQRKLPDKKFIDENQPEEHICDFCGNVMSISVLETLADGRERCRACARQAINSTRELEKVYQEARKELLATYRIRLCSTIDVHITDAETVAREQNMVFIPTSGFDARPAGFARRRDDLFEIYIENGQPYHMVLATMVHELTHIWQFDSLDMEQLEREHGKVWLEGHAMWTEITCLRKRGIGLQYCDHEENRQDLYGIGFREIAELLERNAESNPFRLLLARYPAAGQYG